MRQIRRGIQRRRFAEQLGGEQARAARRGGHAQALVADRQPQAWLRRVLAKQRQAVRSGGAEAGPGADRIEAGEPRQVVRARRSMRASTGPSTCGSSVSNCREEPRKTCPVGRGWALKATEVPLLAWALLT